MRHSQLFPGNEDGDTTIEQYRVIGSAFLTALHALDRAGELKADSKFSDLALVISLFLQFACGLEDYGIEEDDSDWRVNVAGEYVRG